jgi:tricarballylate dehydrogenase
MVSATANIVVIGHGAAGLAAALSAAEAARAANLSVNVMLLEKASEADAGGNTRWSPSYMRMAALDRIEQGFVHDMLEATKFRGDETYFARLAKEAPATVKWIAALGIEFIQPTYYLAKGPPRIQPAGGGPAVVAGSRARRKPPASRSAMAARRFRLQATMATSMASSSSTAVRARRFPPPSSSPAAVSRATVR